MSLSTAAPFGRVGAAISIARLQLKHDKEPENNKLAQAIMKTRAKE